MVRAPRHRDRSQSPFMDAPSCFFAYHWCIPPVNLLAQRRYIRMTLFVGGPYHGKDLPLVMPIPALVRLPRLEQIDDFWELLRDDPQATVNMEWPFVYELDHSTSPSFYRHVS